MNDNIPVGYNDDGSYGITKQQKRILDNYVDLTEAKKISKGIVNSHTVKKWFDNYMPRKLKVYRRPVLQERKFLDRKAFMEVVEAYKKKMNKTT